MRDSISDHSGCHQTLRFVDHILRDIDSAYANDCAESLRTGDLLGLVSKAMPNPMDYADAASFSADYLAYNLLRKADFLDLGVDTQAAAEEAFLESEESCRVINDNSWKPFIHDGGCIATSLEAKIFKARALIKDALGAFSWNDAARDFGFSSGASTRCKRKSGSPFFKFQGKPETTPGAKLLITCEIFRTPLWRRQIENSDTSLLRETRWDPESWTTTVIGSRADTVPKTWKTKRFICIEPEANMYLQRGIGGLIRRKLLKVGVNLNSQALNQRLARIGSETGSLATIDLKAASDSVSLGVCELLLPADWYEALLRVRSSYTLFRGKWLKLEKMSSMGNGFTFELESLIFWALSKAVLEVHEVGDQRLAVYGDDIVIHNSAADHLIELLSKVGFETNKEKTFTSGPFRESCGKHYFYGADVSPFNIKEATEDESRFYWLVNSYNYWLLRNKRTVSQGRRRIYRDGRKFAKRFCVVPPGYGFDSGIETPANHANVIWSMRKQQYVFKALRSVRKKHQPNGTSALLWYLSLASGTSDQLMLYKGDPIYKRFNACTSRWDCDMSQFGQPDQYSFG